MLMMENMEDDKNIEYISIGKLSSITGISKYKLEKFIDSNLLLDGKYKLTTISNHNRNIPGNVLKEWNLVTERLRRYYAKQKEKQGLCK